MLFNLKIKTTLIAAILAVSFLFNFPSYGNGFHIVEMYPSYGGYEDNTAFLYHTAYVKTSEPYYAVSWYINGIYAGSSGGGTGQTEAYFSPNTSNYPGSLGGTTYKIEAVAWSIGTPDVQSVSDTLSYDVTVYTFISDASTGAITGVFGHAFIEKLGWKDVSRPHGLKPHKGNFGSFGASVYNGTDTIKGYAFKYDYRVIRVSPHGNWLTDVYTPLFVFERGRVEPGKSVHSPGHSDSHTSVRRGADWREGDTFRVEARTVVAAWNIAENNQDELDNQDEWEISGQVDFRVPKDW